MIAGRLSVWMILIEGLLLVLCGAIGPAHADEKTISDRRSRADADSQFESDDAPEIDRNDIGVAFFETHVRPVLIEHCYECHSAEAHRREGGLLLDSRSGWKQGGDSGPAIVPRERQTGSLLRALRYEDPELQMPPQGALPREVVDRIEHWVAMGAPDPRQGVASKEPRSDPSDPLIGKEHWAFRPLTQPKIPEVDDRDWPRSSIDAFVLAKLETAGLQPSPDADRRVLIRRLSMQLTGLPPTRHQVRRFLSDRRAGAMRRLVDRLLSSPAFGQHWGRHWLDLARYADSNGLDENFLFREAWRYRNWVIDAVNRDVPFDRFLVEQISGDLLPFDSIAQRDQQRIAAGFLVVGPKVLLGNDPKKQRMEVADEQIDTIGRAVLGQTLGCARCHDHKFDPIPTADYYSLAGVFTSTQVVERRYMLGQQRVMERLVGLGKEGDQRDEAYEKYWKDRPALVERQKRAKSALELLEKGDTEGLEKLIAKHADAVAEGVGQPDVPVEDKTQRQRELVAELDRRVGAAKPIPPRAMIPRDVDEPADESIRLAGQFDRRGKVVPRGRLRVLGDHEWDIADGESGRSQLAQWLTDSEHGAGHLAARVYANRIWHHLTGRGLVRTVDNFGRTGEDPSHPALLDFLAQRLIEQEWSTKALIRDIVLSRSFAQAWTTSDAAERVDPENRWRWRANRRRLSPEAMRDAMLLIAGQLDHASMDSSVSYLGDQATAVGANKNRRRTDFPNRSIYLPVIRNDLPEVFEAFDFADPHIATGMRPETTVPTQGLFMLNADLVMDASEATARRVLALDSKDESDRASRLFEIVTGHPADQTQCEQIRVFVSEMRERFEDASDDDPSVRAWTLACHALFASSRFQMVE